ALSRRRLSRRESRVRGRDPSDTGPVPTRHLMRCHGFVVVRVGPDSALCTVRGRCTPDDLLGLTEDDVDAVRSIPGELCPPWRAAGGCAYNRAVLPQGRGTRAWAGTQAPSRREQVRAQAVAAIPWWYSPWGRLAFPSFVGLGLIAASIALLEHPTTLELLTVPVVLVLVNLNEWHVHRNILHQRMWPLEILFWRHTPEHHVIFVRDDMAMRANQEFRLVLIPFYGILAIFVSALPITAALWFLVSHNVALLWVHDDGVRRRVRVAAPLLSPARIEPDRTQPAHQPAPPPSRHAPHARADAALELQCDGAAGRLA